MTELLIIYDGYCVFCESWVNLCLRNINNTEIKLVHLSDIKLKEKTYLEYSKYIKSDTIIVIDDNKIYFKSAAALKVFSRCNAPYNFLSKILNLFPYSFLNIFYDLIGYIRYKIFGKKTSCEINNPIISKNLISSNQQIPQNLFFNDYFEFNFKK